MVQKLFEVETFSQRTVFLFFFVLFSFEEVLEAFLIGHSKDVEFWLVHMKINWIEERWRLLFLHLIMLIRLKLFLFTNSVAAEIRYIHELILFLSFLIFFFVFGEIVIKVDFENFSVSVFFERFLYSEWSLIGEVNSFERILGDNLDFSISNILSCLYRL